MKHLKDIILEKLTINSKTKIVTYNYFPKDRNELKKLLTKLIKERGNKANLNDIDVSNITNLEYIFHNLEFNGDISGWEVSNVENMHCTFMDSDFNGDISKWNVSNVKNMNSMFYNSKFNGDISKWNVSNVKNMDCMFRNSDFNGDISKWNISNVENMNNNMFNNSPLEKNPPKWYKK